MINDDGTVNVLNAHDGGRSLAGPGPSYRALLIKVLTGVPLDERETEEVEWLKQHEPPCNIWPHPRHDGCPGTPALG
jgi:hypothetical protein